VEGAQRCRCISLHVGRSRAQKQNQPMDGTDSCAADHIIGIHSDIAQCAGCTLLHVGWRARIQELAQERDGAAAAATLDACSVFTHRLPSAAAELD
jgi:hypothetical protein